MLKPILRGLAAMTLVAGLSLPLTLSEPALADTVTITDTLDRKVEIPDDPQRILLGFYFEDFFAVAGPDAYDRVVAISRETWHGWRNLQWNAYTAVTPRLEELIDVGEVESGTFSLETAIAAKPDLAILAAWQYNALGDVAERLETAGVPIVVIDYNAQKVEKHVASTKILGKIMGTEERADKLAQEYAGAIASIQARLADVPEDERPKVYVELGNKSADEIGNSYAGTMWGVVVEMAGGKNIADGQITGYAPLSPEYVLAENPQAIFLAGSGWAGRDKAILMGPGIDPAQTRERMLPYMARAGWSELDATAKGNVHSLYHGGARTLYDFAYLQYMAKALHPDLFADLDPDASLSAFFDTYMPISFKGSYMTSLK